MKVAYLSSILRHTSQIQESDLRIDLFRRPLHETPKIPTRPRDGHPFPTGNQPRRA